MAQAVDSFSIDDIYILVLLLLLHLTTIQKILNVFYLYIFNAPIYLKRGLECMRLSLKKNGQFGSLGNTPS